MSSPASRPSALVRLKQLLLLTPVLTLLAGCGATQNLSGGGGISPSFTGNVIGGQQPVVGATVQLYAAGLAGNASAAIPLLTQTILSDANGSFTFANDFTCPSNSAPVYLVATGGNPGLPGKVNNSALTLVSALGSCANLTSSTFITVNEVSTAAAAWALAPFAHSATQIGSTSTNLTGLNNAFHTATDLADTNTGLSPASQAPSNATINSKKIYSLANILASCVNSAGDTPCTNLFSTATPTSGTLPTDTFQAALSIVTHPANNVDALFGLIPGSPAFNTGLSTAPPDWTLTVKFTGGGLDSPTGVSVDAAGNIWVASYFDSASLFSPTGQPAFANGIVSTSIAHSYGIAVDAQNDAWIPTEDSPSSVNGGNGDVAVFNSSGQSVAGPNGYSSSDLAYPVAVAIDPNTNVWVVDYGTSAVSLLSSSGVPLSGTRGFGSEQLQIPVAIAIDASHNAWIANQSGNDIARISSDGTQVTNFDCCNGASGIAIDQNANVWVTNYYDNSVSQLNGSGTVISTGYTGGGIDTPQGIAIDGAGNVWVANYRGSGLTELAGSSATSPGAALSPTTGLGSDTDLFLAFDLAIDASGNIWVTGYGDDSLTQFVGLATPVKTPLIGPPQLP